MHQTELKIFRLLFNTHELLSGYIIAKKTNSQISSAYYFLDKMVKNNVLIKFKNEGIGRGHNLYGLNPVFFDARFWEGIIDQLIEVLERLKSYDNIPGFELPEPEYTLKLIASELLTTSSWRPHRP